MFYRSKFVTNSSSTSFIAWGYVIPEELCSKYGDDDFLDILCAGGPGVEGCTDEDDHVMIYARESYLDTDDAYKTVGLGVDDEADEKWGEQLRAFAEKLGATLGNLAPGWFFTHHAS
jgi:hypothetical protein